MPSEATNEQIQMVAPFLEAHGVPGSLQPAIWQAIAAAGLTVVDQAAGEPVQVTDSTVIERIQVTGEPGLFLCGVQVGTRGWVVWMERQRGDGTVERWGETFAAGSGLLLLE